MLDALSSVLSFLSTIIDFVVYFFNSTISFITHIPTYTAFLVTVTTSLLPAVILPFAAISISIYVVLFLIGRNS